MMIKREHLMAKKKTAPAKTEVVVIETCPTLLLGWESLLAGDFAVQTAAPAKAPNTSYALISADLGDPGFKAAAKIRKRSGDAKIVFYSKSPSDVLLACTLEVDADGFFNLNEPHSFILSGLRNVLENEPFYSIDIESRLVKRRSMLDKRTRLQTLSNREREVLVHLAEDYSIKQTAEELGLAPTTVETHRQAIRAKLDLRGFASMARFAINNGMITLEK
ncbi:MAG: response regulator transcription factor [Planctomycetales bacterium]